METEGVVKLKTISNKADSNSNNTTKIYIQNSKYDITKYLYIFLPLVLILIIIINIFYFLNNNKEDTNKSNNNLNSNIDISKGVREIEDTLIFDENMKEKYKTELNDFCNNQDKYFNKKIENQLTIANISLLSNVYKMYVYSSNDYVSLEISTCLSWESDESNNLLNALFFYSSIYDLKPHEIYFLDIGANIGWYSLFLAKNGYNVLSFEPSEINNYIFKKNYCFDRDLNITIINKGLYNDEKKCNYYTKEENKGFGTVFCDENKNITKNLNKSGQVTLTKLSNYIPFLLSKNLALIKIKIDGSEGKAIEGGIKLITKHHIPFIFLEFNPEGLEQHGTNPIKLLKMFLRYGYKFPNNNFFDSEFLSINDIMEKTNGTLNLYIVKSRINKKYHDI